MKPISSILSCIIKVFLLYCLNYYNINTKNHARCAYCATSISFNDRLIVQWMSSKKHSTSFRFRCTADNVRSNTETCVECLSSNNTRRTGTPRNNKTTFAASVD